MEAATTPTRDPAIARRRRILFFGAAAILLALVAVAVVPLLQHDKKPVRVKPPQSAVILARVELKPVGGGQAKGLAEILRRGQDQSIRVLATKLPPSREGEVYGLFLAGGAPQRLLGSAVVGSQRIFVGEAKVGIGELEKFKRIELRRATTGQDPKETIVLRGKIPH